MNSLLSRMSNECDNLLARVDAARSLLADLLRDGAHWELPAVAGTVQRLDEAVRELAWSVAEIGGFQRS